MSRRGYNADVTLYVDDIPDDEIEEEEEEGDPYDVPFDGGRIIREV